MELEKQSEMEETVEMLSDFSFKELEKRNLAITKLHITQVSTGIYGRILLHLTRKNEHQPKEGEKKSSFRDKFRKFTPGDIVGIFQSEGGGKGTDKGESADGIVYKVLRDEIIVSYNEMHDFENFKQPLNMALLANTVTYERCKQALDGIEALLGSRTSLNERVLNVLFEREHPHLMKKE